MQTIHSVVLVAHVIIALLIIALVLIQKGKGAEAGAAFGAGASGTVFGARGSSSFMSRATGILATAFFASSLTLAYMSTQRGGPSSLLDTVKESTQIEVPGASLTPDPDAADELPALPDSTPAPDTAELPSLPEETGAQPDVAAETETGAEAEVDADAATEAEMPETTQ